MNRTLVKSPPELWSELSEVERLANHLGELGEIRISRLEPEHTVAWEGDHACGTVELEASGWGTKVTMTAEVREQAGEEIAPVRAEPGPELEPEPPRPSVHELIPDLEAWDRSAAEIERHALRQSAAADRAAERAAERARRQRRSGGLTGWLFRSRRAPEPEAEEEIAPVRAEPGPSREEEIAPVRAEPGPSPWGPPPPQAPEAQEEITSDWAEPEPEGEVVEGQDAPAVDEERVRAVLETALDNLGAAHHRPFSRG